MHFRSSRLFSKANMQKNNITKQPASWHTVLSRGQTPPGQNCSCHQTRSFASHMNYKQHHDVVITQPAHSLLDVQTRWIQTDVDLGSSLRLQGLPPHDSDHGSQFTINNLQTEGHCTVCSLELQQAIIRIEGERA